MCRVISATGRRSTPSFCLLLGWLAVRLAVAIICEGSTSCLVAWTHRALWHLLTTTAPSGEPGGNERLSGVMLAVYQ